MFSSSLFSFWIAAPFSSFVVFFFFFLRPAMQMSVISQSIYTVAIFLSFEKVQQVEVKVLIRPRTSEYLPPVWNGFDE